MSVKVSTAVTRDLLSFITLYCACTLEAYESTLLKYNFSTNVNFVNYRTSKKRLTAFFCYKAMHSTCFYLYFLTCFVKRLKQVDDGMTKHTGTGKKT